MKCWQKSIKGRVVVACGWVFWVAVLCVPALADTVDRVVAKVNSKIITLSAVQDRAQVIAEGMDTRGEELPSKNELMRQALNTIVDERLQVQEAKKLGLKVSEESVLKALDEIKKNNRIDDEQFEVLLEREGRNLETYKTIIRDQILVSRITRREMGNRVKITNKEMKKYYSRHQKDFWEPPKVRARHILFIIDENAPEKDIRLKKIKAREILRQVRAGKDFAKLARKYSEDVSAHSGGDIGIVEHGKMVKEFEDVVFRLKPGETSGIVVTPYGLHIIKCDEVIPGKSKPFDSVKDEIRAQLSFKKEKKIYKDWIRSLKEKSFIEVSLFEGQPNLPDVRKKKEEPQTASLVSDDFFSEDETGKEAVKSQPGKSSRRSSRRDPELISGNGSPDYRIIKKKLRYFKRLRDSNKISEREYQKRKKELLRKL